MIGSNCDIAPGVSFVSGSHEIGGPQRRAGAERSSPIKIGSGCWIRTHATILGGLELEGGSIVAAGSLVLPGAYPPNVLLGGVPAGINKFFI